MEKRPPITDDQSEQIATMRGRKGWSYARIAKRLDLSEGAVSWHCLVNGIEPPNPRALAPVPTEPVTMKRGKHVMRHFTAAEDAQLLRLEGEGLTMMQIARRLGRRRNSIVGRLATLARRDERAEAIQAGQD